MLAKAGDSIATPPTCFKNLLSNVMNDSFVGMSSAMLNYKKHVYKFSGILIVTVRTVNINTEWS